ncbi:hypothetical protein Scep_004670 [Stephania cephalantha]|uniref:EF-hand domain-containing protein n=1 Tax=Stephania cephalantha TaxID=152367 RepID=A0AAP0PZB9_9MAGN
MGAPARAPQRRNGAPRSLLSSPLPSAPLVAPQEGRGGTPHIPYSRWDPSIDEAIVRAAYDAKACVRYDVLMHEFHTLGVRPNFVTDEAWNRYRDYWASADFRARSEKASYNKKNEKGATVQPFKAPLVARGLFGPLKDILALDKDDDGEITPNDVFLHVHAKDHDGVTFIDSRSTQFHLVRRREEHTQETPNQPIDEEQLYYNAMGVCPKGRVYGLGSLARKTRRYADPGASTSQEARVRRSEFDTVVQRLAQFEAFLQSQLGMRMDFGANTSQAPPPPPPQEHHQQVGMDPTCSPQQHDDDDRDNPDWVDEEHLGDEMIGSSSPRSIGGTTTRQQLPHTPSHKWRPPDPGLMKMNVDASVITGRPFFTVGGVLRDQSGAVYGVFARQVVGIYLQKRLRRWLSERVYFS